MKQDNTTQPNRLSKEKSPYLLQHQNNPVNWYGWCQEAFDLAREQNKPIFLSIGYSTCHWCHVMAHESFEDIEVAQVLNRVFICIKVDREERPDIDSIYMKACHLLTGSGGWPLTVMMDHDLRPFFAGTYIPKTGRYGRIGLIELAEKVEALWQSSPETIINSAKSITNALKASSREISEKGNTTGIEHLEKGFRQLIGMFDNQYGGFGSSPKFPSPHTLLFLMRYYHRTGNKQALLMVEKTLQEMSKGGMYDHIGDGFHRYSTDRKWLLPHFEKTLYDQAMLTWTHLEAYQITGKEDYSEIAQRVLGYVERELTDPDGGFYCGEDADSEGKEGKYYIWTKKQVKDLLGDKAAEDFFKVYNFVEEGNFCDESTGERTGENIPHLSENNADTDKIKKARELLFQYREKRVHPCKDDKILTDWNGLMIGALAKAGTVLNDRKYIEQASKAVAFIRDRLLTTDSLLHRYRDGESGITAMLDDYAFLSWGLLELYEAGNEIEHLKLAIELTDKMIEGFLAPDGGFYFSGSDELIVRNKEIYDGAIPSGNSVAMYNLLRLGEITGNSRYNNLAETMSCCFSGEISKAPAGYCFWLVAGDFALGPVTNIIINGQPDDILTQQALEKIHSRYLPNKTLTLRHKSNISSLNQLAPSTSALPSPEIKTTIYICRNKQCEPPVSDLESLIL